MKKIRNKSGILAVIALILVCLSFSAAPASAALDRGCFEAEAGIAASVGEGLSTAMDYVQDSFAALMHKLGGIFASQSGSSILD